MEKQSGSLDSINEKLKIAAKNLDLAAKEISELPLEPAKEHIINIGEALANIFDIQNHIYSLRPDLQPDYLDEIQQEPDPELSEEEKELMSKITSSELEEIDNSLLSNVCDKWRKVARIIGSTIIQNPERNISDIFYSQRIHILVTN